MFFFFYNCYFKKKNVIFAEKLEKSSKKREKN